MTDGNSVARKAANGAAWAEDWTGRRDPLPYPAGDPPGHLWCPAHVPPDGFEFMAAVGTQVCFLQPCPVNCPGWGLVVPDGSRFGYRLAAEVGCTRGCEAPEILWWQSWRLGDLPALEPDEPDERARRYATGVVRRVLGELPDVPSVRQLRRAAFIIGKWVDASGLPVELIAGALLSAAARAGFDPIAIAPVLAAALTAGRARPGRVPR
jgi:hypothetical protein